jgi:hypothetical protein
MKPIAGPGSGGPASWLWKADPEGQLFFRRLPYEEVYDNTDDHPVNWGQVLLFAFLKSYEAKNKTPYGYCVRFTPSTNGYVLGNNGTLLKFTDQ